MASRDAAARDRRVLAAALVAIFALSAVTHLALLASAAAAALLLLRRGAARSARRTARTVLPITAGLSLASWLFVRVTAGAPPEPAPFVALALRSSVIAFVTFSVLDRVNLLRALAPWPVAARLLVLTLAQIHALRLLARESALGLESRLPRRPGIADLLRNAAGITAVLLTLALRNARDVSDALRSRGF